MKIEPHCSYCQYSVALIDRDEVGCIRHGVVSTSFHCRRFRYDPFKRTPLKPARLKKDYVDADFQL